MILFSDAAQFSNEVKVNNRTGAANTASRGGSIDDRPITPMRGSYKQVAEKFIGEDDPQFYDNRYNDRSPTRERDSYERTLTNPRAMSASQRSTMNSMSRTIDPRYAANVHQQIKNMSPSRTVGSATKQRASLNTSADDGKLNLYIKSIKRK